MNKPYFCRNFFLTDWSHMLRKNTIEISPSYWNVLLWIFSNCFSGRHFLASALNTERLFFWSAFSRIRTEYRKIRRTSKIPNRDIFHAMTNFDLSLDNIFSSLYLALTFRSKYPFVACYLNRQTNFIILKSDRLIKLGIFWFELSLFNMFLILWMVLVS